MLPLRSRSVRPAAVLRPALLLLVACPSLLPACALGAPEAGADARPFAVPAGIDLYMPAADEVPLTTAVIALGRRLFHDPILSRNGSLACVTCHQPERAFTDGRVVAVGVEGRQGRRNTPTLVNRAYGREMSWDGAAASLSQQVLRALADPHELDLPVDAAVRRLRARRTYAARFQTAFGAELTDSALAHALAAYVRSILSGDSRFDRYLLGDTLALSHEERRGRRLFVGKARCTTCHHGPNLTDEQFHNTGVAWRSGSPADPGRYLVTRDPRHLGAFKTPTLREVARTAPYMHDGSLATLEEVIEFYDRGGHPNPHLDPEIRPLRLTAEEKGALVAFLHTLSGRVREGVRDRSR